MASKSILKSKTFWTNLLGPVFTGAAARWGLDLDAETQAEIVIGTMALANILLRLITKGPVHLGKGAGGTAASLLIALVLVGCAGAVPGNLQGCAGITRVEASFGDDGKLRDVSVCQGKEGESFDVNADLAAGRFDWTGKGVRAFDGQKARAEVEKAVSDDAKAAMPGIVDSIMEAVKRSFGVP